MGWPGLSGVTQLHRASAQAPGRRWALSLPLRPARASPRPPMGWLGLSGVPRLDRWAAEHLTRARADSRYPPQLVPGKPPRRACSLFWLPAVNDETVISSRLPSPRHLRGEISSLPLLALPPASRDSSQTRRSSYGSLARAVTGAVTDP
jgi:hypothetical protein